jgi:hypothetical protein
MYSNHYKNYFSRIVLLTGLLFFMSGPIASQSIKGVVHIANHQNQGIGGVKVLLFNSQNQLIDSTISDAEGDYMFDSLPFGTYRIGMVKPWDFNGIKYADIIATILAAYNIIPLDTLSRLALDIDIDEQITVDDALDLYALMTEQIDSVPLDHWVFLEPEVTVSMLAEYEEDLETSPPGKRRPLPGGTLKEPLPYINPTTETQLTYNSTIQYQISSTSTGNLSGFQFSFIKPDYISIEKIKSSFFDLNIILVDSVVFISAVPDYISKSIAVGEVVVNITMKLNRPDCESFSIKPARLEILDEYGDPASVQFAFPNYKLIRTKDPIIQFGNNEIRIENTDCWSSYHIIDLKGIVISERHNIPCQDIKIPLMHYPGVYILRLENQEGVTYCRNIYLP